MRRFRLRVEYSKENRLALLSHLEITRALERIVRRANLPFAITEGFSPHMKISFGSALPVGVGGKNEIYDVYLKDYVNPDAALRSLQASSPKDLFPHHAKYIDNSSPAASVAYPIGVYLGCLSSPLELSVPKTIEVVKKKKTKVVNIEDHLRGDVAVEGSSVRFALEALPTGSLRPDLFLLECIKESLGGGPANEVSIVSLDRICQLDDACKI